MKQIATFSKVEEAEMLRAYLEGAGIMAAVRDAHTVSADWTLSNAIGGVKVDVADTDADQAIALLGQFQSSTPPKTEPKSKPRHKPSRYVKIAAVLFILILIFIASTIGFRGDVSPGMLVFSAGGIGVCVAIFCAMYDL